MLEAGTFAEEWKPVKPLALGPKGKNGFMCSSLAKTEVPSAVWVVVIKRGAGREGRLDMIGARDSMSFECQNAGSKLSWRHITFYWNFLDLYIRHRRWRMRHISPLVLQAEDTVRIFSLARFPPFRRRGDAKAEGDRR